jgi:hypothetical protein
MRIPYRAFAAIPAVVAMMLAGGTRDRGPDVAGDFRPSFRMRNFTRRITQAEQTLATVDFALTFGAPGFGDAEGFCAIAEETHGKALHTVIGLEVTQSSVTLKSFGRGGAI